MNLFKTEHHHLAAPYTEFSTDTSSGCLHFLCVFVFLSDTDSRADGAPQKIDHAVIGGVVAVVVFAMLCLLIVLGRYFARHKGKSKTRLWI